VTETCAEFATRWPDDYAKRNGEDRWAMETDYCNRIALRRFIREFGATPLRLLPENRRLIPWAHSMPPSVLKVIRAMLNDARRSRLIPENPLSELEGPKSNGRREIEAITEDELDLLGNCALEVWGKDYGPMARAYVLWQGTVGTRPIAVRHLKKEHVDLEAGEVYLEWPGKKVAPRTVIVPPKALEALSEGAKTKEVRHGSAPPASTNPLRGASLAEWLFTTPTGRRLSKPNEVYIWKPIRGLFETELPPARARQLRDAREAGGSMQLYELRHCAATSLRRRGASWEEIAWQLCHTDKGVQARKTYSHLTDEDHMAGLRRIFA
jgi:integrase